MSIEQNLLVIKATLPEQVTLVAVSKTKPISDLMEAYEAGQRIFGENKIQEMAHDWSCTNEQGKIYGAFCKFDSRCRQP